MAVPTSKKIIFHKIKKTVKKVLTKIIPKLNSKKKQFQKTVKVEKIDYDSEINDNLHNEALEARLRQIIEASPASILDEDCIVATGGICLYDHDSQTFFSSFWVSDEDESCPPNYSNCARYRSAEEGSAST